MCKGTSVASSIAFEWLRGEKPLEATREAAVLSGDVAEELWLQNPSPGLNSPPCHLTSWATGLVNPV